MTRYGIFLNQKIQKKVIEFLLMLATLNVKKEKQQSRLCFVRNGWLGGCCLSWNIQVVKRLDYVSAHRAKKKITKEKTKVDTL